MGIFEQQNALTKIVEEMLEQSVPVSQVVEIVSQRDLLMHKNDSYFKNKEVWGPLAERPYHATTKFVTEIYKPIEAQRLGENALYERHPSMRQGFFFEAPKVSQGGKVLLDDFGNPVLKRIPDYDGLAKYLREERHLKATVAFSHIYEEGRYRMINDGEIKQIIDSLTLSSAAPYQVREFSSAVSYKNYCSDEEFIVPEGYINLKNGILNITTKELRPHTPTKFFSYVLPHAFDRAAACIRWTEWLKFIFQDDQALVDVSAEIFGYLLAGGEPWLHKAFFLEGSGRNGKSTWLHILKALMGSTNYCSISLKNLDKPFSVVLTDGKLANIVGELDSRDLSSEAFKTAVGGEELTAAHKGKPEYMLKFRAKIVAATNNPLNFKDSSPGNYEKLYILPFNRYITEEDRDPHIVNALLEELPGILNWALDGYQRLLARGRLPQIEAVNMALEDHRISSDTVFHWHTEFVRYGVDDAHRYQLGTFYDHYVAWCKREGRFALSKNWFVRGLLREIRKNIPNLPKVMTNNKTHCIGRFAINAKPEFNSVLF